MINSAQGPPESGTEKFYCAFCRVASFSKPQGRSMHQTRCKANPNYKKWSRTGIPNAHRKPEPKREPKPKRKVAKPPMVRAKPVTSPPQTNGPKLYRDRKKPSGFNSGEHVPRLEDLPNVDEYEKAILYLLCTEGKYHSTVALTCDLYGTSEDVQEGRVLESHMVQLLVEDLNLKGLCVYRLSEQMASYGMPVQIKPTHLAYETLRLPFAWRTTVGDPKHSLMERPKHEGDLTDFRSFSYSPPVQEPVTREDFIDHCTGCDHLEKHRLQLLELFGSDQL